MSGPETVTLVGEGGVEWEFELPLSEVFADQVKGNKLAPKSDDDRAKVADLFVSEDGELAPAAPASADPPTEKTLAERIDAVASHAEANELAVELGVEGFEEKKPALADKRAALQAAATAKAEANTAAAETQ